MGVSVIKAEYLYKMMATKTGLFSLILILFRKTKTFYDSSNYCRA